MKGNKKISSSFLWLVSLGFLLCLVAFTEYRNLSKYCIDLIISIEQGEKAKGIHENNFFIDKENVEDIITYKGRESIEGKKLIHINVSDVENRVKMDKFVKDVEVSKTLKGELEVKVTQRRPIARFIRSDSAFYISDQGVFLPMSNRYTARVILISEQGKSPYFLSNELNDESDSLFYELLTQIDEDDFFNKIVSEIIIKEDGELWFRPQVSRQMIIWGLPIDTKSKYKRLKKLYKDILPSKGWNKYQLVNLSFKDQIICE
jgi:cell division protein FtsQ